MIVFFDEMNTNIRRWIINHYAPFTFGGNYSDNEEHIIVTLTRIDTILEDYIKTLDIQIQIKIYELRRHIAEKSRKYSFKPAIDFNKIDTLYTPKYISNTNNKGYESLELVPDYVDNRINSINKNVTLGMPITDENAYIFSIDNTGMIQHNVTGKSLKDRDMAYFFRTDLVTGETSISIMNKENRYTFESSTNPVFKQHNKNGYHDYETELCYFGYGRTINSNLTENDVYVTQRPLLMLKIARLEKEALNREEDQDIYKMKASGLHNRLQSIYSDQKAYKKLYNNTQAAASVLNLQDINEEFLDSEITHALTLAMHISGITKDVATKIIQYAIKNDSITKLTTEEAKTLIIDRSKAINFSKTFQDIMKDKHIMTGREKPKKFVGMRLKRINADKINKYLSL